MQDICKVRETIAEGLLDGQLKAIYVDESRVPYNRERHV